MGTSTRSAPARSGRRPRSPGDGSRWKGPVLLVNCKAYPRASGPTALRLGLAVQAAARRVGVAAAISPAAPVLGALADRLRIPVFAQHADPDPPGARTGRIVVESLRSANVFGSLVNHSEHPLPFAVTRAVVRRLDGAGLSSVVCAPDLAQAARLATLHPPFLAIEPPELIGGTVSVSSARPGLVRDAVARVARVSPSTRVLCGAGVNSADDVRTALALGAHGVLVASAIARAERPVPAIARLLEGFSPPPSR